MCNSQWLVLGKNNLEVPVFALYTTPDVNNTIHGLRALTSIGTRHHRWKECWDRTRQTRAHGSILVELTMYGYDSKTASNMSMPIAEQHGPE